MLTCSCYSEADGRIENALNIIAWGESDAFDIASNVVVTCMNVVAMHNRELIDIGL